MVKAERRIGTECACETRYYLLSHPLLAKEFGQAVRSHWGIENRVHWVLDLAFREDLSRIRRGYAAENKDISTTLRCSGQYGRRVVRWGGRRGSGTRLQRMGLLDVIVVHHLHRYSRNLNMLRHDFDELSRF
jgi:hypothetical protein